MRRVRSAVLAMLGVASLANGQTSRSDPTDLQGWIGSALRLDLPDRWRGAIEYRLRLIDNASDVRGSYITLTGGRKVADPLTLFTSYRLALVDNGRFHRYAVGAEAEREAGRTTLALRGIVQYQKQNFTDNDETSSDEDVFFRTRFEVKRQLSSRLDLYASTEPYFTTGEGYLIDNWRNTVGAKLELAKGKRLDLFYIYRPDYAKASYNRTFHIIGVDLDWALKISRKKAGKGDAATPR